MIIYGYEYISIYFTLVRGTSYHIQKDIGLKNSVSDVSKLSYIYNVYNDTTFQQRAICNIRIITNRQLVHLTKRNLIIKLASPGYIINPLIIPFLDKLDQDYKKILLRKKII